MRTTITVLVLAVVTLVLFPQCQTGSSKKTESPAVSSFDDIEEGLKREQARFDEVLQQASDEELFIVLKYAIAHRYVPNREVDPFGDVEVMVGGWQRSLMVYKKLSDREDLLRQIYPDLDVLDEYIRWGHLTGKPYPDTIVSQAILNNVQKDIKQVDSLMESPSYLESMRYKYYGLPIYSRVFDSRK